MLWKWLYCPSNLQIQCNSYQITKDIFHRTGIKNFIMCMETQKTLKSQSNLEKEKWSWPPSDYIISSVQFSRSVVSDSVTPWTTACQASLSITNSWSLLKLMSIESIMPSNHLILCCPLLLLASIFPNIRVFSNESGLHIRWPKYWSFSVNISCSNELSGLISFRMDWLDLLTIQGTLKSLQHHS